MARHVFLLKAGAKSHGQITESFSFENLSSVHTCKSCFEKVLSFDYTTSNSVPDGCPRWNPTFGSAWDCEKCRVERKTIEDAHPARAARLEAAGQALKALFSSIQGEEDAKDNLHEAAGKMASASSPFHQVQATDTEIKGAMDLSHRLLMTAMREQAFVDEVTQNKDWDTSFTQIEWAEAIILILRRHTSNVESIVREWTLVFDDRPPWCRAWVRVPVNRRRMIIRGWEAVVRETLRIPQAE